MGPDLKRKVGGVTLSAEGEGASVKRRCHRSRRGGGGRAPCAAPHPSSLPLQSPPPPPQGLSPSACCLLSCMAGGGGRPQAPAALPVSTSLGPASTRWGGGAWGMALSLGSGTGAGLGLPGLRMDREGETGQAPSSLPPPHPDSSPTQNSSPADLLWGCEASLPRPTFRAPKGTAHLDSTQAPLPAVAKDPRRRAVN